MRGRFLASTSSTIVLGFALALATATLAAAAAPSNLNVTAMPGNEAEDAIAVNPTNPSNVVAMSTLPDVVAGLAVGVSFNDGQTWTRRVIGTAVDPDGLGAAGFGKPTVVAHSHVGGFDFIPAQPNRSIDAEASLAWDRSGGAHNGRIYLVWTQETPNESDNTDIMLQRSDNNGATWSPAIKLNDDLTTNSQYNPAIALDQSSGDVAVSWYDTRNDLGTGGSGDTDGIRNNDFQIWATDSTNGGTTLAPNFQVSEGTSNAVDADSFFDTGDYTHAAFVSGVFWPAWSDNSNSTGDNPDGTLHQFDLYTAKVSIP